ncbi:hypothetical protein ACE3NQ_08405 [Paenibacillus terreus]|uniref:Uncharacterized protein n=1 Tax=Paenibacillus terreus TaxID=1387834 RepID=A0ABV5B5H7_9BACL
MLSENNEYEKLRASLKLMSQLTEGEQAGKEKGWMSIEEVKQALGILMKEEDFS